MRVFATGGTGFIGPHVVRKLENEGHTLLLLSRRSRVDIPLSSIPKTVELLSGDVSEIDRWKDEVERFRPEAAVHMAWEAIPNYDSKTSVANLKYGLNLITSLAEIGCKRVICTGSCWEYGQQRGEISEDMAVNPSNAFTAAKNALHWLGREIAKENDMQFIWTRLFYVYGPGQRERSLIPYIIDCVQKDKKPEIKTSLARNDFVYVEDVARAISMILKNRGESAVYNIGSGYSTSVQQVIEIVHDRFNRRYSGGDNQQNGSVVDFWADISRIKGDTGWEPQVGIKEGIQKAIDCYLDASPQPAKEF